MKEITFDFENVGGLAEIYAIPPTSFLRIRNDYVTGKKYLEVKNRDDIIVIPMFPDDSFVFNENKERSEGGDYYELSIEGVIPKQVLVNKDIISTLERGVWYVLCKDNNDVVHLCGTEDVLMTFSTQKTTGTTYIDRNSIAFTFSNKQPTPSDIIEIDNLSDI